MTSPVVAGAVHRHVPEDLYSSWSPSLSPDASQVAFISDRGGYPQVWLRHLDGGPLRHVPLDGRITAVSWSPTGEWLACLRAGTRRVPGRGLGRPTGRVWCPAGWGSGDGHGDLGGGSLRRLDRRR